MALPAPKIDPLPDSSPGFARELAEAPHEALFRTVEKPDGEVVVEKVPLSLDVLLHPREEDQMSQSRPHERQLGPLADLLERFLERRPGVAVFSEMMILWEQLGERDVAPDVCVVQGVRDREAVDTSFDPVAEGVGPCLVIEVVSSSTRAMVKKDERKNPPLYERMKVEDLVLVYPRRPAEEQELRLDVRRLDVSGRYRANRPGPGGWILLPSVDLRVKVADDGLRLLVEDVRTGERLLTSVEEEAARRAEAEARRTAEERAGQEAEARCQAEERVEQEAEARRQEAEARRQAEERVEQEAEARHQAETLAEQEAEARRQAEERVEQGLRRGVEDLCAVLGLAWGAERSAQVESMSASRLEALRAHLVSEKSWPESFSDA